MYLKAMAKYPDDATLSIPVVPVGVHATFEGMKTIMINDVKKGKLDEIWALLDKRLGMFLDIQGFRYVFEYYSNLEEAMQTISAQVKSDKILFLVGEWMAGRKGLPPILIVDIIK